MTRPQGKVKVRPWAPATAGPDVEGYPDDAASVPAGFLYNGALSTYENLGFTKGRQIGKNRWVVTTAVEPSRDQLRQFAFVGN